MTSAASVTGLLGGLTGVGRDPETGGYHRGGLTSAEREADAWFLDACAARGLDVETDSIGNRIAWWRSDRADDRPGIVTGSHLDSVPHGGNYDGPLGVACALAAVDRLREDGFVPTHPLGLATWVEEEGSRFGMPCLGSRLATGRLAPESALALCDRDGVTLAEAYDRAGLPVDPQTFGLSALPPKIAAFVELHVEQGRWLVDPPDGRPSTPVGVADAIWPHGRWRLDIGGRADHAGTTRMQDRCDPMLTAAYAALAASKQARLADARATVGRLEVVPGATNAIPDHVRAWLDVRAADQSTVDAVVAAITATTADRALRDGTEVELVSESKSERVAFDPILAQRLMHVVGRMSPEGEPAPLLSTAAGHDAGILAAQGIPTAMLFVRNPTGISHSPQEYAEADDCEAGAVALAAVLADLAGPGPVPRR